MRRYARHVRQWCRHAANRWGPLAVVVALLAGTAIAFATTERQKLEKTPFDVLHVTEAFSPLRGSATLVLRLRHPHLLTVQIVNSADTAVTTLAHDERFGAGRSVFHWRGRSVRDGVYEPRITIDDGRVYNLPNPIRTDTVAPRVTLLSFHPLILRPQHKPRVRIAYRVSEPAHVILYVNGHEVLFGGAKALRSRVDWYAERQGRRLPRGTYRLRLAAVDLAGNSSRRDSTFLVRIR
jgi:hypothetical protein